VKASYILRNLKLIERNTQWLRSNISGYQKLKFYIDIPVAYLRYFTQGKKYINYLGNILYFDNPATPLNIQIYPYEIGSKIFGNMDTLPGNILDIGGNIGQFSITAHQLLDRLGVNNPLIDVFEPNPAPFDVLSHNTKDMGGITIYNVGVGPKDSKKTLYYEENRSGTGSFDQKNTMSIGANIKEQQVSITANIQKYTGTSKYDLIKIDVEGFEYEVLRGLRGLKTSYLYVELSMPGRELNFDHSDFFNIVENIFGTYRIAYVSKANTQSHDVELLLKFI